MEIILEANALVNDENVVNQESSCPADMCCVFDCTLCAVDGDGSCGIDY